MDVIKEEIQDFSSEGENDDCDVDQEFINYAEAMNE